MITNDVLRRRQTPISSGFRQDLLQHDHLNTTNVDEQWSGDHRRSRPPYHQDDPIVFSSTYEPPDNFDNNPTQYNDPNMDQLLYLSTPKPISIRRTIQSQTPIRTSIYNSNEFHGQRMKDKSLNPAFDYGSNSLFSYGCCCLQCVRTTEVGIAENFGRFEALLDPGLHCLPWPLLDISGRLSLRIKLLEVTCETRTSDSVFCNIVVTLQYRIIAEKAYDAYYRLTDPSKQIQSYVFDIIRSKVPTMTLDEVFASKKDIANDVEIRLQKLLNDYGYEVLGSLVTDIRPADSVAQSMNEINVSKRMKVAMVYKAEADKIKRVKDAEAHCESLFLHGVGTAGQQKALLLELKEPCRRYMKEGDSQNEIMNLLFMTQYMDTIDAISRCPTKDQNLLFGWSPGHLFELKDQLKDLRRS